MTRLIRAWRELWRGARAPGRSRAIYSHEIAESTFRDRGIGYDAAHAAALRMYGAPPFSLYPVQ